MMWIYNKFQDSKKVLKNELEICAFFCHHYYLFSFHSIPLFLRGREKRERKSSDSSFGKYTIQSFLMILKGFFETLSSSSIYLRENNQFYVLTVHRFCTILITFESKILIRNKTFLYDLKIGIDVSS